MAVLSSAPPMARSRGVAPGASGGRALPSRYSAEGSFRKVKSGSPKVRSDGKPAKRALLSRQLRLAGAVHRARGHRTSGGSPRPLGPTIAPPHS
eukprot:scaffold264445_cov28-Tisochrysis_lutea.AAC.1